MHKSDHAHPCIEPLSAPGIVSTSVSYLACMSSVPVDCLIPASPCIGCSFMHGPIFGDGSSGLDHYHFLPGLNVGSGGASVLQHARMHEEPLLWCAARSRQLQYVVAVSNVGLSLHSTVRDVCLSLRKQKAGVCLWGPNQGCGRFGFSFFICALGVSGWRCLCALSPP